MYKMKILYFTSTGNNLYISKKLGGELFSIPQLMKNNDFNVEDDVVGIVFPVYFATSPKMIRKFLEKVNIVCNYLFLICSYGSDGDQNAFRIMIKTLKKKGLNVNYANSVLMVDNFLPVFDMAKEKAIKNDSDIDKQIELIKNDIESRKNYILSKKHFTDVPFIEKVLEKTMTSKYHIIVGEDCINCKICKMVCPQANVTLTEDGPIIGDNCEFCFGCVHHCKQKVLSVNDELNSDERYINPHIKLSEIIKSNYVGD